MERMGVAAQTKTKLCNLILHFSNWKSMPGVTTIILTNLTRFYVGVWLSCNKPDMFTQFFAHSFALNVNKSWPKHIQLHLCELNGLHPKLLLTLREVEWFYPMVNGLSKTNPGPFSDIMMLLQWAFLQTFCHNGSNWIAHKKLFHLCVHLSLINW